jgi:hypothetical protein
VDGSALGAGNTVTFNGSAETDGSLAVTGGAGNDLFTMGAALTAADRFDGGAGNDTLVLNGDYSGGAVLGTATIPAAPCSARRRLPTSKPYRSHPATATASRRTMRISPPARR